MRVAGTFFLMQHLEDSIGDDVEKRSQVVQQVNAVVKTAQEKLGLSGTPVFEYEESKAGPSVKLVTTAGLLDVAIA